MRDLLARLFPKRLANDGGHSAEDRIKDLEIEIDRLRAIIGTILLRADGSTRKSAFAMIVEHAFNIHGRGSCVIGKIEKGVVKLGDRVLLESPNESLPATILAVEMYKRTLDRAEAGDNVGLRLGGITLDQVLEGVLLRSEDV